MYLIRRYCHSSTQYLPKYFFKAIGKNFEIEKNTRLNLQFPKLNLVDIIMQNTTYSHMHSDRRVSMTTLLSSAVKSASIYTVIYLGKYGVKTLRIFWH